MTENTKRIAVLGMLVAAQVVAGRLISIPTPIVTIGFIFLPLAMGSMLYGPVWGAAAAALGDILIAALSPYGYYPPMTLTAILSGAIYGIFLYQKPANIKRIILCVVTESLLASVLLQTYWITQLSGKAYMVLLPTRIMQNLITAPISVICIRWVAYPVIDLFRKGRTK